MKYFKIVILLVLSSLIISCGTIKEGFTNQKKNSSDEFLVEKKSPLVLPPDYNELPEPITDEGNKKNNNIKKLVTNTDQTQKIKQNVDENFEKSILEKIKNN